MGWPINCGTRERDRLGTVSPLVVAKSGGLHDGGLAALFAAHNSLNSWIIDMLICIKAWLQSYQNW